MEKLNFCIPTEAIPAIIGHQGLKIKDIEAKSKTRVIIDNTGDLTSKVRVVSILSLSPS